MKYMSELEVYVTDLKAFVDRFNLPREWFKEPDHVAIKCQDAADYKAVIAGFSDGIVQQHEVSMNGRHLASALVAEGIPLGGFGSVQWLEVMEPRPERVGQDVVGIDHTEFYYPDLAAVQAQAIELGVEVQPESNPHHNWLTFVLNDRGQELKITDSRLAEAAAREKMPS